MILRTIKEEMKRIQLQPSSYWVLKNVHWWKNDVICDEKRKLERMLMLKMIEFWNLPSISQFSTHHIYKISSQFFAIIFTTFSIHKIVTEKNYSQYKNWHIAANKTKYFPHELIWQISNFRYSKATLHAKLKSQKTLWKKN